MKSLSPVALSLILLTVGCGTDEAPQSSPDGSAPESAAEVAERAASAFVPTAEQFGLEQFMIVYDLEGQETGTRTMWVEEYGDRVGLEERLSLYGEERHKLYFWDGERSYMQDLPDGEVFSTGIRTKASEPTSFATTPADDLTTVGYERVGEKTIAGRTCEHWRNENLNYEGCRWNNVELEFLNGAGTERILQRVTATELREGEDIPQHIRGLAE